MIKFLIRYFFGCTVFVLWTAVLLLLLFQFFWEAGAVFIVSLVIIKIDGIVEKRMKGLDPH